MFMTMHAFLLFFFPTLALILLGILFEEKLIAFEHRVFVRVFQKAATKKSSTVNRRPATISRVEHRACPDARRGNRAA